MERQGDRDGVAYQFMRPVFFDTASLPLLYATAVLALVIPFVRLLCVHLIFRPIGKALLPKPSSNNNAGKVKKGVVPMTSLEKWEMACWSLFFYVAVTLYGLYVTATEPWFTKTARMWYDCENIPCHYPVTNELNLQYCLQLGFYIQAIPALYVWDLKRKDFYQMVVHHIATIGLICYSIRTNLVRAGAMILLIHDVCDVFMEAAKLFRYLEYNDLATVTFAVFVVVWIAMRVVYLPLYLMRSCLEDTIGFIAIPYDVEPEPHFAFLNGLLALLYCIHLYWTFLILKIVWSVLILKKDVDDVREDEEEEKKKKN